MGPRSTPDQHPSGTGVPLISVDTGRITAAARSHPVAKSGRTRLQRAVEPQRDVVAPARHGLDPVLLMTRRRLWPEPDGDAAVLVHLEPRDRAVHARELLIGRQQRAGLVVVDSEGPEVLGRDRARQRQLVGLAAIEIGPVLVAQGDGIDGAGPRLGSTIAGVIPVA